VFVPAPVTAPVMRLSLCAYALDFVIIAAS